MSLAARLGQVAVVLIILGWLVVGAVRRLQRRRAFLDHLRRLQEP